MSTPTCHSTLSAAGKLFFPFAFAFVFVCFYFFGPTDLTKIRRRIRQYTEKKVYGLK